MSLHAYLALTLFAFVTAVTPGPNNLMLLASGVNFGFRASLPHFWGVSIGGSLMVLCVGLGLYSVFAQFPWLYEILKWLGAIYLVYLAFRLATIKSSLAIESNQHSKPLSFINAALFQWVNPKLWVVAVSVFSIYVPPVHSIGLIVIVALIFYVTCIPSLCLWLLFGARLSQTLQRHQRPFNVIMAGLLIASIVPTL